MPHCGLHHGRGWAGLSPPPPPYSSFLSPIRCAAFLGLPALTDGPQLSFPPVPFRHWAESLLITGLAWCLLGHSSPTALLLAQVCVLFCFSGGCTASSPLLWLGPSLEDPVLKEHCPHSFAWVLEDFHGPLKGTYACVPTYIHNHTNKSFCVSKIYGNNVAELHMYRLIHLAV